MSGPGDLVDRLAGLVPLVAALRGVAVGRGTPQVTTGATGAPRIASGQAVGVEASSDAAQRLRQLAGEDRVSFEARVRRLVSPLGGLVAAGAVSGVIDWRFGDAAAEGEMPTGLRVDLDPVPAGTHPGGTVIRVRMRLSGMLPESLASAAVSAPRARIESSLGGGLQLFGWAERESDIALAEAVADLLEAASRLSDLPDIAGRLADGRLAGLRGAGEMRLRTGGRLALDAPLALVGGLAGGPVADIAGGVSVTRQADMALEIGTGLEPGGQRSVVLRLRRRRGRSRQGALRFSVEAADAGLLDRLRALSLDSVSTVARPLKSLLGAAGLLLPPSRALGDALASGLGDLGDLAGDGAPRGLELDAARVGAAIDALPGIWTRSPESLVSDLAAALMSRQPGDGPADAALDSTLADALRARALVWIERLRGELREHVAVIAGDRPGSASFSRAADAVALAEGDAVPPADLDALLARTSSLLDHWQGHLGAALTRITETESLRLGLAVEAQWRREQSDGLMLGLRLDPGHEDAPALYRAALAGDLAPVLEAARVAAPGGPILAAEGELVRASLRERRRGLRLAMLDTAVALERVFRAEVVIRSDLAGPIAVLARGDTRLTLQTPGEIRTLTAVNAFDLAVAHASGRATFRLTLSHAEEDLAPEQVEVFFGGLEDPRIGLVPAGFGRRAARRLAAVRRFDPALPRAGRLEVALDLDQAALLRLLQLIVPEAGAAANPFSRRWPLRTALRSALDGIAVSGSRADLANMHDLVRRLDLGAATLDEVLLGLAEGRAAGHGGIEVFSVDGNTLALMGRIGARAAGLGDAVEAMRELYCAAPLVRSGAWGREDFERRQGLIDAALSDWFRGEQADAVLTPLLDDRIRPYTLGLLAALARLARRRGRSGAAPLMATLFLPGLAGRSERPLPLD